MGDAEAVGTEGGDSFGDAAEEDKEPDPARSAGYVECFLQQ